MKKSARPKAKPRPSQRPPAPASRGPQGLPGPRNQQGPKRSLGERGAGKSVIRRETKRVMAEKHAHGPAKPQGEAGTRGGPAGPRTPAKLRARTPAEKARAQKRAAARVKPMKRPETVGGRVIPDLIKQRGADKPITVARVKTRKLGVKHRVGTRTFKNLADYEAYERRLDTKAKARPILAKQLNDESASKRASIKPEHRDEFRKKVQVEKKEGASPKQARKAIRQEFAADGKAVKADLRATPKGRKAMRVNKRRANRIVVRESRKIQAEDSEYIKSGQTAPDTPSRKKFDARQAHLAEMHRAGVEKELSDGRRYSKKKKGSLARKVDNARQLVANAGDEVHDTVANAIPTVKAIARAGSEAANEAVAAAKGDAKKHKTPTIDAMVDELGDSSPLVAAAQGDFKEALYRFKERPVSGAFEVTGAGALVGAAARVGAVSAGGALRAAPKQRRQGAKVARRAAAAQRVARAPLAIKKEKAQPVGRKAARRLRAEGLRDAQARARVRAGGRSVPTPRAADDAYQPVERTYARNSAVRVAQVGSDRVKTLRGLDPNVATQRQVKARQKQMANADQRNYEAGGIRRQEEAIQARRSILKKAGIKGNEKVAAVLLFANDRIHPESLKDDLLRVRADIDAERAPSRKANLARLDALIADAEKPAGSRRFLTPAVVEAARAVAEQSKQADGRMSDAGLADADALDFVRLVQGPLARRVVVPAGDQSGEASHGVDPTEGSGRPVADFAPGANAPASRFDAARGVAMASETSNGPRIGNATFDADPEARAGYQRMVAEHEAAKGTQPQRKFTPEAEAKREARAHAGIQAYLATDAQGGGHRPTQKVVELRAKLKGEKDPEVRERLEAELQIQDDAMRTVGLRRQAAYEQLGAELNLLADHGTSETASKLRAARADREGDDAVEAMMEALGHELPKPKLLTATGPGGIKLTRQGRKPHAMAGQGAGKLRPFLERMGQDAKAGDVETAHRQAAKDAAIVEAGLRDGARPVGARVARPRAQGELLNELPKQRAEGERVDDIGLEDRRETQALLHKQLVQPLEDAHDAAQTRFELEAERLDYDVAKGALADAQATLAQLRREMRQAGQRSGEARTERKAAIARQQAAVAAAIERYGREVASVKAQLQPYFAEISETKAAMDAAIDQMRESMADRNLTGRADVGTKDADLRGPNTAPLIDEIGGERPNEIPVSEPDRYGNVDRQGLPVGQDSADLVHPDSRRILVEVPDRAEQAAIVEEQPRPVPIVSIEGETPPTPTVKPKGGGLPVKPPQKKYAGYTWSDDAPEHLRGKRVQLNDLRDYAAARGDVAGFLRGMKLEKSGKAVMGAPEEAHGYMAYDLQGPLSKDRLLDEAGEREAAYVMVALEKLVREKYAVESDGSPESLAALRESTGQEHVVIEGKKDAPPIVVPKVVADRLDPKRLEQGAAAKGANWITRRTIRATLPLSVAWHAGNAADLMLRLALSLPPQHLIDPVGNADLAKTLHTQLEALDPDLRRRVLTPLQGHMGAQQSVPHTQFGDILRSKEWGGLAKASDAIGKAVVSTRGPALLDKFFDGSAQIESALVRQATGSVAKRYARELGHHMADVGEQMGALAKELDADPAKVHALQSRIMEITGDFATKTPMDRRGLLGFDIFFSWFKAANKFVLKTLPTNSPGRTAMLFLAARLTADERAMLGMNSYWTEDEQRVLVVNLDAKDRQEGFMSGAISSGGADEVTPTGHLSSFAEVNRWMDDPKSVLSRPFGFIQKPVAGALAHYKTPLEWAGGMAEEEAMVALGQPRPSRNFYERREIAGVDTVDAAGRRLGESFVPGIREARTILEGGHEDAWDSALWDPKTRTDTRPDEAKRDKTLMRGVLATGDMLPNAMPRPTKKPTGAELRAKKPKVPVGDVQVIKFKGPDGKTVVMHEKRVK